MPPVAARAARPATLDGVEPAVGARADRPTTGSGWSCAALPAKQRAAVVHRFVLDLAYAEIGARMGISEEAARQNVSAGLRRLRGR